MPCTESLRIGADAAGTMDTSDLHGLSGQQLSGIVREYLAECRSSDFANGLGSSGGWLGVGIGSRRPVLCAWVASQESASSLGAMTEGLVRKLTSTVLSGWLQGGMPHTTEILHCVSSQKFIRSCCSEEQNAESSLAPLKSM